ncbi:MAG: metallophosphoesterase [Polyangiaceae bacterium]|nr:metallophosphoesterase [Polyangiaceae bacterium]MCL4750415.1 metallophosphoesterase [Myxococcales bacterium]
MQRRIDYLVPAVVLAIGLGGAAVSCGSDDDGGGSGGQSSGGAASGGAAGGGSGGTSAGGSSGAGGAASGGASGAGGASGGGGTGVGGAGTGGGGAGIPPDKQNLRVAFFGDTSSGTNFKNVLGVAMADKADFILGGGDYDYSYNPSAWLTAMNSVVGADYPIFGAVGNHDHTTWEPYATEYKSRMQKAGIAPDDPDFTDEKFSIVYRGIKIVFVGQNGKNTEFADYIKAQFATDDHIWRLCVWHKNQQAMQVGGKGNEMGWGVYENCRDAGAIILTAHEHSYHRTRTLTDMTNQVVDSTCSDPKKVCVGPGRTFAVVSGLGGNSVRDQERCLPSTFPYGCKQEWGFIYTSNQNATYGTVFIDFYVNGDPKQAKAYFKNVQNQIVDEFDITKD